MAAALQVFLLGRFEAVVDGRPVPRDAWRHRRPADLLKLLALAPGHALRSDEAIDALWPDKDPESGANNLHRALHDLRQTLGGRVVDLEHGVVTLRKDAEVDAARFERAVRAGEPAGLADAVSLYRGDLSPEDPESPWLIPHRRRLRELFFEAVHQVADHAVQAGDLGRAVSLLRRLAAAAPAAEEAQLALVRLLARDARRTEALCQYQAFALARAAAGRGPPSHEAEALREAIARGELGPLPGHDDGWARAARRLLGTDDLGPLRGRQDGLALVEALLGRGTGVLVLLGTRGAGTTRLALEAARMAGERGFAVLVGRAEGRPDPPAALFADALDLPALDAGAPRTAAGLVRALAARTGRRPILLVLDDLHAADPTSLALLHRLARHTRRLGLVVVATCHEEAVQAGTPIQPALARLDADRLAGGLRLGGLPLAGTHELLADLLGEAPAPDLVPAVQRATDGLPGRVEALVDAGTLPATPPPGRPVASPARRG